MDDHPWTIIMITSVAVRIAEGGSKGGGPEGAGAPPGIRRYLNVVRQTYRNVRQLYVTTF